MRVQIFLPKNDPWMAELLSQSKSSSPKISVGNRPLSEVGRPVLLDVRLSTLNSMVLVAMLKGEVATFSKLNLEGESTVYCPIELQGNALIAKETDVLSTLHSVLTTIRAQSGLGCVGIQSELDTQPTPANQLLLNTDNPENARNTVTHFSFQASCGQKGEVWIHFDGKAGKTYETELQSEFQKWQGAPAQTKYPLHSSANGGIQNGEPLYDLGKVKAIGKTNKVFFFELISSFLEHTPVTLLQMERALEKEDFSTLHDLAHQLAPSLESLGMRQAYAIMKTIERLSIEDKSTQELSIQMRYVRHLLEITIEKLLDELNASFQYAA